jgi:addiction module RelB/DinJ family antitoxin
MPATKDVIVRARLDRQLKEDSETIFEQLGMSTNEAIRIFFSQVRLRKALPFEVGIPVEDNSDILMSRAKRQKVLDLFYDD